MVVGGQPQAPAALHTGRPGTHWVGPRACLNGCGKSRPPPGFDPRTVQPVTENRHKIILFAHSHNWLCSKGQPVVKVLHRVNRKRHHSFPVFITKNAIHHIAM